jgi:hypothetical protein
MTSSQLAGLIYNSCVIIGLVLITFGADLDWKVALGLGFILWGNALFHANRGK